MNILNDKINICRDGKSLARITLKLPKKSAFGDFDIIIDSAKNKAFEQCIILSNEEAQSYQDVAYVSWHGYYELIKKYNLLSIAITRLPVIRLHNQYGDKINTFRHKNTINPINIFYYPVCSIYLPKEIDDSEIKMLNTSGMSSKNVFTIRNDSDCRIDFFVLPYAMSAKDYYDYFPLFEYTQKSTDMSLYDASQYYELRDIYDTYGDNNIDEYELSLQNCGVFLRYIYSDYFLDDYSNKKYSLLFYNSEHVFESILNRSIFYGLDNGEDVQTTFFEKYKDAYEKYSYRRK